MIIVILNCSLTALNIWLLVRQWRVYREIDSAFLAIEKMLDDTDKLIMKEKK